MRRTLAIIAAVGCLLVASAGVLVIQPHLADHLGFGAALDAVGNGYILVAVVAGMAFFYALYVGMSWWLAGDVHLTEPPAVETLPPSNIPGTELDEAVAELIGKRGRAARTVGDRDRIQERLTNDAVQTIARAENIPPHFARERVEAGEWTENRYATDFVGGEDAPTPRRYQRFLDRALRRDPFERRVHGTISALTNLEEVEP